MKKVHVYPHTHWDYEWYFTANETIIQLIYHMDEVIRALENGDLKTYLLDGQVSILEEYLKYIPENYDIVHRLVQEKKLLIGPWYTQSDELIISGESIVRNLYYGITSAKKLGHCFEIGYLPDSFGQSQDMPKIYSGFNIDYAIFWRGVNPEIINEREFFWKSHDGSQVLVSHIKNGYYYGGNIIYNDDVESVEKTILDGAGDNMLLPVGGDQRYVDFNLKERIAKYNNESVNQLLYEESDCLQYFESIKNRKYQNVYGEFIDATVSKIHHSIYSSRYDHKYLNDKIERRMIYQLEPLMLLAQMNGMKPKMTMIEKIWKTLLMNHAHDSACGCNSDKTNQSILQRLIEADQLSYSAMDYLLRKISESLKNIQTNDLIIYNTLAYQKTEPFKLKITTHSPYFEIYDQDVRVPFDILTQEKMNAGSIRKNQNMDPELDYYESCILIRVKLDSLSMKVLQIKECEQKNEYLKINEQKYIEDNYYRIEYNEGQLNLYDKNHHHDMKNFIEIEDCGDDGDTYDWSPLENDKREIYRFSNAHVQYVIGKTYQSMVIKGQWQLYQNLDERCKHGQTQEVPYVFTIKLLNTGRIDFHLEVDNQVKDHRMRIIMDTPVYSDVSISDTQFDTIQRKNNPDHMDDWQQLGWKEEPTPIYPMIHHVSLRNDRMSASALVKGIKEYEIIDNHKIALTLFRSVGYLGKPDLLRRPGIASGNEFKYIPTPDSQLLKSMKFKFSLMLSKNYDEINVIRQWENMAISPLYYQIQELNRFVNTQKYFVTHPLPYDTKVIPSIVDASETKKLVITSISSIDEKNYYVRMYNPYMNQVTGEIYFNGQNVHEVNLLLETKQEVELKDGYCQLPMFQPKEIKTFKITL